MATVIYTETLNIVNQVRKDPTIVEYLDLLRRHHSGTYNHSLAVAELAVDLGIENNLSRKELLNLAYSGLLHDVGKLYIPVQILTKRGKLKETEMLKIKTHSRKGFEMLKDYPNPDIAQIIVGHHEYQTDPYPRNNIENGFNGYNKRNNSPFKKLTEIIAISDHYDALTSKRSYGSKMSKMDAEKIIKEQLHVNPILVGQVLRR